MFDQNSSPVHGLSSQKDRLTAMSLHLFTIGHQLGRGRGLEGDRPWDPSELLGRGFQRLGVLGLCLAMAACSTPGYPEQADWDQYQNERYDFTFPYPDTWIPGPMQDNLDGRAFRDPHQEVVSIRGWASQVSLPEAGEEASSSRYQISPNFTTDQGLEGQLQVDIGQTVSTIRLTLTQEGVIYSWEGRSPSDDFDDYFKFFYYVAQQYHIEPPAAAP